LILCFFTHRAYGGSPEEFLKVLAMPSEFIKYRNHFGGNGLNDRCDEYDNLSDSQKIEVVEVLSNKNKSDSPEYLEGILSYYSIKKVSG